MSETAQQANACHVCGKPKEMKGSRWCDKCLDHAYIAFCRALHTHPDPSALLVTTYHQSKPKPRPTAPALDTLTPTLFADAE